MITDRFLKSLRPAPRGQRIKRLVAAMDKSSRVNGPIARWSAGPRPLR
jgi:hypothetical protein